MREQIPLAKRELLQRKLLGWYRRSHRDLPWRRSRDPYRIWLSETMLQQTRVETVIPYYDRFLERFPTVEALACADEEDVLRHWAGLGYYARARNLKRAAEAIVRDHGGELPREAEVLATLPGVGPYTVGAIRSIAYRERAALVDGNVARVFSRLLARPRLSSSTLWSIAWELVPEKRADLFNQALMELGATVCTPRKPACVRCPLRDVCRARDLGRAEDFPEPRSRTQPRRVEGLAGVLESRGRILLLRRPSRGLLGGLWETPTSEGSSPGELVAALEERTGIRARPAGELGRVRHLFTHRALELRVLRLQRLGGRLRRSDDARWCGQSEVAELPLSVLMKKALRIADLNL